MNRTAFVLSIISLFGTFYFAYLSATNSFKIEALETRIEHMENLTDASIRNKVNNMIKTPISEENNETKR